MADNSNSIVIKERSLVVTDQEDAVPDYVCVDYPGDVVNDQNMIATLGGIEMISKVFSDANRRMELRFKPDNFYIHPLCGERTATTSLLVKFTKKVRIVKDRSKTSEKKTQDGNVDNCPVDDVRGVNDPACSSSVLASGDNSYRITEAVCSKHVSESREGHSNNVNVSADSSKNVRGSVVKNYCSSLKKIPLIKDNENKHGIIRYKNNLSDSQSVSVHCTDENGAYYNNKNNTIESPVTKLPEHSQSIDDVNIKENANFIPKSQKKVTVTSTLLGTVKTTYTFDGLFDYIYLPTEKLPDGSVKLKVPMSCLTPQNLELYSWLTEEPQVPFLPPASFSRMDTPQFFYFRGDGSESFNKQETCKGKLGDDALCSTPTRSTEAGPQNKPSMETTVNADAECYASPGASSNTGTSSTTTPNVIYRTRTPRFTCSKFRSFYDPTPDEPEPKVLELLQQKFLQDTVSPLCNKLQQLFRERPIWSKNALRVKLGHGCNNLRFLLPTIGYYFSTGPWRHLWVRYGYDPRVIPASFTYQTFDYRFKQTAPLKNLIKAKRSYTKHILPYKSSSGAKRKVSVIQSDLLGSRKPGLSSSTTAESEGPVKRKLKFEENYELTQEDEECEPETPKEDDYIFRPGTIPPYRQMFYQYCDLLVPEVQQVLSEAVVTCTEKLRCDEKTGWLPKDAEENCRRIISRLVDEAVARLH